MSLAVTQAMGVQVPLGSQDDSMRTDIDRLHQVALGEIGGRGCGKTFLMCHSVAGAIETGSRQVAIIVPELRWMTFIKPMLYDVLREHGLNIEPERGNHRVLFLDDGTKIMFVRRKEIEEGFLRGIHPDPTCVDMDDSGGLKWHW